MISAFRFARSFATEFIFNTFALRLTRQHLAGASVPFAPHPDGFPSKYTFSFRIHSDPSTFRFLIYTFRSPPFLIWQFEISS